MERCKVCLTGVQCTCGRCHGCGKYWLYGLPTGATHSAPFESLPRPKTQKAIGLEWLLQHNYSAPMVRPSHLFPLSATQEEWKDIRYPIFARPCPRRPRHGFVESRVVNNWAELDLVRLETLAADPEGEMILCPFLPSLYNAVLVPTLFTVGKGHDGATLGKDVMTFPLIGSKDPLFDPKALAMVGIGPDESPYIEVIYPKNYDLVLTQLRAGPKLAATGPDYIPTTTVVKEVIKVDLGMSLLVWEKLLLLKEGQEGVVVWHPGGSLIDHFSVHCRTVKIPICTTFEPVVGQVLYPTKQAPLLDPNLILRGLVVGDRFSLQHDILDCTKQDAKNAIILMLHALHNSFVLGGAHSFWVGVGVALMLRYGTIALRGEARHIHTTPLAPRDSVYARALPHSLSRHRAAVPRLVHVLRYGKFGGGAVGGIKWAVCGYTLAQLFNAVGQLAKEPTEASVNKLLRAWNVVVNQAHNGGWWLNKFAPAGVFEDVRHGTVSRLLPLAPLMYRFHEANLVVLEKQVANSISLWRKWCPLNLHPFAVQEATLTLVPGVEGVALQLTDRLLKTRHKTLVLHIPGLIDQVLSLSRGKLYVETTPNGLRVCLQAPHEQPILIWQEKGIDTYIT